MNGVPDEARLLLGNLPGVEAGPRFVQHAVESALPGFGKSFVALAILPFAFTTILALYYMAETNVSYLCRDRPRGGVMGTFQLLFLAATGYSAMNSATVAWALGDIGVGMMSWLNIIAILLLQRPALAALRDYEDHRRHGRDPLFNPKLLGVRNTSVWVQ
ncbi:alanine:cation symporter family protein [Stenotrophomonas maltophilia]|nr:alanine:cation symporter family protein [Stenotrophomonas maltophilia]MCO7463665.1 alanine:cation symporter family protein [Stenotrophomonas maltophilia]